MSALGQKKLNIEPPPVGPPRANSGNGPAFRRKVYPAWAKQQNFISLGPRQPLTRFPASAPADDFMHAHKWKRGVRENVATVKEIRRKASKIAPAYNKGALQYLPDES